MEKKIVYLLDLNYTLVSNQRETRSLRPFSRRMEAEEYRSDLIDAIRDNYVIMITARPHYQSEESIANVEMKTGWKPDEWYFNERDLEPPACKRYALLHYVFPKHGLNNERYEYVAIESNPRTRAMYAEYGIRAMPYEKFIKELVGTDAEEGQCDSYYQMELF